MCALICVIFSQFLILPPFQRQGHGAHLLQTFYNDVVPVADVLDITGEFSSEDGTRLPNVMPVADILDITGEFSSEDGVRLPAWRGT